MPRAGCFDAKQKDLLEEVDAGFRAARKRRAAAAGKWWMILYYRLDDYGWTNLFIMGLLFAIVFGCVGILGHDYYYGNAYRQRMAAAAAGAAAAAEAAAGAPASAGGASDGAGFSAGAWSGGGSGDAGGAHGGDGFDRDLMEDGDAIFSEEFLE